MTTPPSNCRVEQKLARLEELFERRLEEFAADLRSLGQDVERAGIGGNLLHNPLPLATAAPTPPRLSARLDQLVPRIMAACGPVIAADLRDLAREIELLEVTAEYTPPRDVFTNLIDLDEQNKDGNPTDWGDVIRRLQEWKGDVRELRRERAEAAAR